MNKQEQAIQYHIDGYNCSQAVVGVLAEELGLPLDLAMKISSGYGGGIRCGSVCGAVTGAIMALGLKYGQTEAHDQETKMAMYQLTTQLQERFKEKNKTLMCKELLGCNIATPEGMKEVQDKGLSRSVCDQLIANAVEIVEEMIEDYKSIR